MDLVKLETELLKAVSILIKSIQETKNLFLFYNLNLPCSVKFN